MAQQTTINFNSARLVKVFRELGITRELWEVTPESKANVTVNNRVITDSETLRLMTLYGYDRGNVHIRTFKSTTEAERETMTCLIMPIVSRGVVTRYYKGYVAEHKPSPVKQAKQARQTTKRATRQLDLPELALPEPSIVSDSRQSDTDRRFSELETAIDNLTKLFKKTKVK